jgi:hypothetical protein
MTYASSGSNRKEREREREYSVKLWAVTVQAAK